MSDIKNRTSQQIESALHNTQNQQTTNQKNGDYVGAEECRLKVEQLKKDLQVRKIYQMEQRHKKQFDDLSIDHSTELNQFQKSCEQKTNQFRAQSEKQQKDMLLRHEAEIQGLKLQLEKQLSTKIKQSSELLNLRKMEEHMVKQKNYVQAHRVQTKAQELQNQQKEAWMNNRNIKIQTSINQLKNKQAVELAALKKKIQTTFDQYDKQKFKEETRLQKKFNNEIRQQKSRQEKQVIQFKGQFRSKGGQSSPVTSKSRIH